MFPFIEKDIEAIKTAFKNNSFTSYELVLGYLNRISSIDQGEIPYNSVLEVNPDALYDARQKDFERSIGKSYGYLHGIPVLLKDNINTVGKMHTTAGTIGFKDNYAPYDAFIVKRLKEEGAIILGKTNLTELANFMTINMRNGYSSLGGKVLCPYNIKRDPSGSSSGSAVSVALNLAPIAIGTETGGSIMSPSMQNGIVGLKPTMGLVSRTGIVPISSTLDTAGPMGKNVYDVALLLSALRGNDALDPITNTKEDNPLDYTKFLNQINPRNIRIGIENSNFSNLTPNRKSAFLNTIEQLKKLGVTIVDNITVKPSTKIYHVMLYEFKQVFNSYLASLGNASKIKTLLELINFNRSNEQECLKYGQMIIEEAQYKTSGKLNEQSYIDALNEKAECTKILKDLFIEHNLDAIYFSNYTSLGPHCGFPTMTVPIGVDENKIPIGTYLLSNHFEESRLLRVGKLIESTIQGRINPLQKKEDNLN